MEGHGRLLNVFKVIWFPPVVLQLHRVMTGFYHRERVVCLPQWSLGGKIGHRSANKGKIIPKGDKYVP